MIEKLECTCIEAYTTRKMRDPNCCACSCDHNDLVEQLAKTKEDYKALFSDFESCQDELKESNERESVLSCQLDSHIERVAELEKENKRESMELRSRLGSALGRNSEYNSAIENMQQKLAKVNERVKELEKINTSCAVAIRQLIAKGEIGHLLITGDELDEIVNKFAIEKKIEALEGTLRENSRPIAYPHGHNTDVVYSEDIKFDVEQLRKEQDSE